MKGALAIFAKTPGLTPAKTRLGKTIGQNRAEEFYCHCLSCIEESVQKLSQNCGLSPFWAVAEEEGLQDSRWQNFEVLFQGEGSLGQRLAKVYSQLIGQFDYVIFIGTDSPHITAQDYQKILQHFMQSNQDFALGETEDGGYYFFVGTHPMEQMQWLNVEYSSTKTAKQFKSQLPEVLAVKTSFDVDNYKDLKKLKSFFLDESPATHSQRKLNQWLQRYI